MVLLEKLWDDVVAGPQPDRRLGKLRKLQTQNLSTQDGEAGKYVRSLSSGPTSPATSSTPATPTTPNSVWRENVWRSVFHPGSNLNTRGIGNQIFDKPAQPSSPTIYDWLYSGESRSKHV